jgi:hypothetical protein
MQTKLILIAAGALASFACSSGDPVNIGENDPGKTGEQLSDYAATWDGYAEGYRFASGSDRVRLVLDENGEGYLEVGDAPLFAPATDPDAAYPVEVAEPPLHGYRGLTEGFRYTARFAQVEGARVQVGFVPLELYTSWCELQTPYPSPIGAGYNCLPSGPVNVVDGACILTTPDGSTMEVDCYKVDLCGLGFVCSCSAEGCGAFDAESLAQAPSRLDGALENGGNSFVGSFQELTGVRIRLTRQ